MTAADRQQDFRDKVTEEVGGEGKHAVNYGVSNIARFVDGGLLLGIPNLDNFQEKDTYLVTTSRLDLAPSIEFHFSALIRTEFHRLRQKLDFMVSEAEACVEAGEEPFYSDRNNNVSIFVGMDGKIYLRNRKASGNENLADIIQNFGDGLEIDYLYYSIFEPTLKTLSHPLVHAARDELARLIGQNKVIRLNTWESTPTITMDMCRRPTDLSVQDITKGIDLLGGHYKSETIENFHNGLNYLRDKHFVILSGVSGTGKTSLVTRYSKVIHGIEFTEDDPLYFICAVRPDWTDPSGLLGYFDIFSNQYIVPKFLNAIFHAIAYPDSAIVVCLDEMNIGRVEHYFADVLSVMETNAYLQLHTSEKTYRSDNGIMVPSRIKWPNNLYIVGTINIDETTNPLSDKVLDRALIIDLSEIDLNKSFDTLESEGLVEAVQACRSILTSIYNILLGHQLAFGRRTVIEVVQYIDFAKKHCSSDIEAVLDSQLIQKVFPKLRGTEKQAPMLTELQQCLSDFPNSLRLIHRLREELDEFGSFQASR